MKLRHFIKNNLIKTLLITTLIGCSTNSDKRENHKTLLETQAKEENISPMKNNYKNAIPWKSIEDYNQFVRSVVNKNYAADIKDIYNFYNIKRELPDYGFKSKDIEFSCFDCTGAVYKENSDSIYFYSSCSEDLFKRFIEYNENYKKDVEEYFTDKIRYYIKHEAAHAFYYRLGKQLGEEYLFNIDYTNKDLLYQIQHSLIEEGVAEYIAYKGQLTPHAEATTYEDFKKMVEDKNDTYLYSIGLKLVKPILDKNFEEGIIQLIKNPLSKHDLDNLEKYRDRILDKLE